MSYLLYVFNALKPFNLKQADVCVTGSAALKICDEIAFGLHHPTLLDAGRVPQDIDVLACRGEFRKVATNGIYQAQYNSANPCLNLSVEGAQLDVSPEWPHLLSQNISDISTDIMGLRVMLPQYIVTAKNALGRPKDIRDLGNRLRSAMCYSAPCH
jgi:hypothetical protein